MEIVIRIIHRYIFWNKGGFGWSIGKKAYLMSGSHWHRSKNVDKVASVYLQLVVLSGGLDTAEPWQGDWENGVQVECKGSTGVDCIWSGFSVWSDCPVTCGEGVQSRHRKVLQQAKNGGKECKGEEEQLRKCSKRPCTGKRN